MRTGWDAAELNGDLTETGRLGEAIGRLLPALERASKGLQAAGYPAFDPTQWDLEDELPVAGVGLDSMLGELERIVDRGCAISSPGFFGFITVGSTTAPAVAQLAASVAGGQRYLHHAFNHIEHTALRWLGQLCGIPTEAAGLFTSGGSTANLIALGAARQAAYERLGVDVAEQGGTSVPPGRIYASDRAHRTIHRSAAALGLGRTSVFEIGTDRTGHIDTSELRAALERDQEAGIVPLAIVAVAGTTDTGSVDPIADVLEIAKTRDCWVHVDGAYGLVANASSRLAPLFEGVEGADSWIVDPHKWLSTGLGVGAVYVRDSQVLTRAFAEGAADYLEGSFSEDQAVSQFDGFSGPWADQGVELSSPSRGVLVWAVLREIGREGIARRVEGHIDLANHLANRIRTHPQLELLCEPDLSIVCYRYVPPTEHDSDKVNLALLEALRRETTTVPTSTVVGGRFALRPCFINPRTTLTDVDLLLANTLRIGDAIIGKQVPA